MGGDRHTGVRVPACTEPESLGLCGLSRASEYPEEGWGREGFRASPGSSELGLGPLPGRAAEATAREDSRSWWASYRRTRFQGCLRKQPARSPQKANTAG